MGLARVAEFDDEITPSSRSHARTHVRTHIHEPQPSSSQKQSCGGARRRGASQWRCVMQHREEPRQSPSCYTPHSPEYPHCPLFQSYEFYCKMNETLAKLFEERKAHHDRAKKNAQNERQAPVGSVSDPICLDSDDDSTPQETAGVSPVNSQRNEHGGRATIKSSALSETKQSTAAMTIATTGGSAKRSRSWEGPIGSDKKASSSRPNDANDSIHVAGRAERQRPRNRSSEIGQQLHQHVPIKLLATRMDEQNRRMDSTSFRSTHVTFREMLGFDSVTQHRRARWLVACNYMIDFDFLMDTVPELLSCPLAVFFYNHAQSSPEPWRLACSQPDGSSTAHFVCLRPSDKPQSSTNPLRYRFRYGTHHTKMFLIGYETGIRVVIFTANLCPGDILVKAQGAYIQDFPMKRSNVMEPCQFEKDLVSYIKSYQYQTNHVWDGVNAKSLNEELARYDFSSAQAVLIPSTPGYHRIDSSAVGLLKLRKTIQDHAISSGVSSPVVCQFSSMGSLSAKWLNEQFLPSTSLVDAETAKANSLSSQLKLVYPTVEEIRTSVEGYRGGGSVPGGKNVQKPFLRPLLCKWSSTSTSNPFQMNRNVPHIKSFYQLGDDNESMNWFLLSSHNMSTMAWGQKQKNKYGGQVFFVQSWELGVFVSPQLFGAGPEGRLVPFSSTNEVAESSIPVPLPCALVPEHYGTIDEPWDWEGKHDIPDAFGRFSASDC